MDKLRRLFFPVLVYEPGDKFVNSKTGFVYLGEDKLLLGKSDVNTYFKGWMVSYATKSIALGAASSSSDYASDKLLSTVSKMKAEKKIDEKKLEELATFKFSIKAISKIEIVTWRTKFWKWLMRGKSISFWIGNKEYHIEAWVTDEHIKTVKEWAREKGILVEG